MLVRELLKRLSDGERMGDLAKEVGLNPSTGIQRKLKRLGYVYDTSSKEWNWGGENKEPLEVDIMSSTPTRQVNDNQRTPKVKQEANSLTGEELLVIRKIIADYTGDKETIENRQDQSLHDRLKGLDQERERVRRNVFLGSDINKKLDDFCKAERMNMSDVIELALDDFISKFS